MKKAKSPTGRPSKVNPDLEDKMKGKGGKRPPPAAKKASPKKKGTVTAGGMVGKDKRKEYLDSL
jgi:hypothetical protein